MYPIRPVALMAAMILSAAAHAQVEDRWGYSGNKGPDRWGKLSRDYATCATGTAQSPIDISATDPIVMNRLEFDYKVTPVDLHNTGLTIKFAVEPGSSVKIGDKIWVLTEINMHAPSEHAVLGVHAQMELEFMHKNAWDEIAVFSVLVKEGREHRAASEFWASLPIEAGQQNKVPTVLVNPRDLMPSSRGFYRYMGSLTTPPCTEGVHWYVMKEPIEMSAAQIRALKTLTKMNARPLQDRNHRMILDSEGTP
ncbi:carbonic anhydrase [Gimibacter soli]|uniref:carbonic anhydrase n=1 Tax=Gimibacter soli TaxID=3024400 RepID=A0AAE9XNE0_9PROT|nr:carbonic anhydrase family protein [Gimibacter soli]WCL54207.1 carbonic anhydrase family protein [Gimibacter soli]